MSQSYVIDDILFYQSNTFGICLRENILAFFGKKSTVSKAIYAEV